MRKTKLLLFAVLFLVPALSVSGWAASRAKTIRLFNGKDLGNFSIFLKSSGREDPGHVFQVHNGMVHVSGKDFGYFITNDEYEKYRLVVEFKWGDETHPPRAGKARDSGILFHVQGPDKVWPRSVEFQMIEGGTGDIILVDGAEITVKGTRLTKGRSDRFNKGAWQDVAGFRDPNGDPEKPHGQWNKLELFVEGENIRYFVNGKLVNEASAPEPKRGRILFQSEGAEVFFRKIELTPLKD